MAHAKIKSGDRIGHWKVISVGGKRGGSVTLECDCPEHTRRTLQRHLLARSRSCGCRSVLNRPGLIGNLIGRSFGRWTVIDTGRKGKYAAKSYVCQCSCVGKTIRTVATAALVHGQSTSCGCLRKEINNARTGPKHQSFKTGKHINRNGYVVLSGMRGHPNARRKGKGVPASTVLEHVYAMSEFLGRPIVRGETVHHKNAIRSDNRIDNLELRVGNHGVGGRLEDIMDYWMAYIHGHLREYAILNPSFSRDKLAKLGTDLIHLAKTAAPDFSDAEVA